MSEEMVKYSNSGAIATITLNRPEKANAIRREMTDQLETALRDANRDKAVKVIVLEGAGDSFCGGFDFSGWLAPCQPELSSRRGALHFSAAVVPPVHR